MQKAVRLLRASILGDAYAAAWQEWSGDGDAWVETLNDGLEGSDAAR